MKNEEIKMSLESAIELCNCEDTIEFVKNDHNTKMMKKALKIVITQILNS